MPRRVSRIVCSSLEFPRTQPLTPDKLPSHMTALALSRDRMYEAKDEEWLISWIEPPRKTSMACTSPPKAMVASMVCLAAPVHDEA